MTTDEPHYRIGDRVRNRHTRKAGTIISTRIVRQWPSRIQHYTIDYDEYETKIDEILGPKAFDEQFLDEHWEKEKTYSVAWTKTYHRIGQESITAYSEEEAEEIMDNMIGNLEGSIHWDPDLNTIEITLDEEE